MFSTSDLILQWQPEYKTENKRKKWDCHPFLKTLFTSCLWIPIHHTVSFQHKQYYAVCRKAAKNSNLRNLKVYIANKKENVPDTTAQTFIIL